LREEAFAAFAFAWRSWTGDVIVAIGVLPQVEGGFF
jgi:hypothetical protein